MRLASLSSTRSALICLVACVACALPISPLFAQDTTPQPSGGVYTGPSTTTTTTVAVTAGIVVLIVLLVKKSSNAQLEYYLNQNKQTVQASLYLHDVHQDASQDLAHMFGVSEANQDAFAALLVSEREVLAPLVVDEVVTAEQAYAFAVHITETMQAHPALSKDVQRVIEAYEREQAAQ